MFNINSRNNGIQITVLFSLLKNGGSVFYRCWRRDLNNKLMNLERTHESGEDYFRLLKEREGKGVIIPFYHASCISFESVFHKRLELFHGYLADRKTIME